MARFTLALVFFCMVPATMPVAVLGDIVQDRLGGDTTEAGWFLSIAMAGGLIVGPLAGFLSDRWNNRHHIIAFAALVDALCFLLLGRAESLSMLMIVRFFEGASSLIVIGLLIASVSDFEASTPGAPIATGPPLLGLAGMWLTLGAGSGFPIGGFLGRADPVLPFYASSAIMLAIALLALLFLRDAPTIVQHKVRTQTRYLLRALLAAPILILPFVYAFVDRFTVGFLISSYNLHLRSTLGFTPLMIGVFMALVMITMGGLSVPAAVASKRFGILRLVFGGSLLYGSMIALSGFASEAWQVYACMFGCGLGAGLMFVPSMLLASQLAPESLRGAVMAGFMASGNLGFLIGPIASTYGEHFLLSEGFPSDQAIVILAVLFGAMEIGLVVASTPWIRRLRHT